MIPPFSKKDQYGREHADTSAPLTKWDFYHENGGYIFDRAHALEFRTYNECERQRKEFYDGWFGTNGHPGLKDRLSLVSTAIEAPY